MSKYNGVERRAVPREGEITTDQMQGAFERALREASFTEGDDMRDQLREVFARAMTSGEPEAATEAPSDATDVHSEAVDPTEKRELTPEVQEQLLATLQARFDANQKKHKGIEWTDVQRSLEADPEKLWSLQQMEEAGHAPDVYMENDDSFYFGTCSVESPESARNIVYDAEAEAWLAKNYPQEICNGNAVDIATAMGIDLMDEPQYRHLQTLGKFDATTWSWLKTLDEIRKRGVALCGFRRGERVYVDRDLAYRHRHHRAFRGSLRVSKLKP